MTRFAPCAHSVISALLDARVLVEGCTVAQLKAVLTPLCAPSRPLAELPSPVESSQQAHRLPKREARHNPAVLKPVPPVAPQQASQPTLEKANTPPISPAAPPASTASVASAVHNEAVAEGATTKAREVLTRLMDVINKAADQPRTLALLDVLVDCAASAHIVRWRDPAEQTASLPSASVAEAGMAGRGQVPDDESSRHSLEAEWWGPVLGDDTGGAEAAVYDGADACAVDHTLLRRVREPGYQSPLLALRAYRLSPLYIAPNGAARRLVGPMSTVCLEPSKPLCRFEMRGACRDAKCTGQHRRDFRMTAEDVAEELAAYGSSNGGSAGSDDFPAAGDEAEDRLLRSHDPAEASARLAALRAVARLESGTSRGAATLASSSDAVAVAAVAAAQRNGRRPAVASVEPVSAADGASVASTNPPGTGSRSRGGLLQLLHAALSTLPQPSPLSADLEKQLQPLIDRYQGSDAAALATAALEGGPLPSHMARPPTQTLPADIPMEAPTHTEAAAEPPRGDRSLSGASGASHGSEASEAMAQELLRRYPHDAVSCWREVMMTLDGGASASSAAQRRQALRVLSRLLERRPDSVALWAGYLSLFSVDGTAADLRSMTTRALRHVPLHPILWCKLAAMQPTVTQKVSMYIQGIRAVLATVTTTSVRDRSAVASEQHSSALLELSLALLRALCSARQPAAAEHASTALLAPSSTAAREMGSCRPALCESVPRVGPLLMPAALAQLWLALVEVIGFGNLGTARPRCPKEEATVLPWAHSCATDGGTATRVRALLSCAIRKVHAAAHHADLSAACQLAVWPLELNAVEFEMALGETGRAATLCQGFIRESERKGQRSEPHWRLYARVLRAEDNGPSGGGGGSGTSATCPAVVYAASNASSSASSVVTERSPAVGGLSASAQLLWQARLSEEREPGGARESKLELWFRLLLTAASSRAGALQIIALAACDCDMAQRQDLEVVRQWCTVPLSGELCAAEPPASVVQSCSALYNDLMRMPVAGQADADTSSSKLPVTSVARHAVTVTPERTYLALLRIVWRQLTAPGAAVTEAFEDAVADDGVHAPTLWLHYAQWAMSSEGGLTSRGASDFCRRGLGQLCATRAFAAADDAHRGENLVESGSAAPAAATSSASTLSWLADQELRSVLETEPAKSFFVGCPTPLPLENASREATHAHTPLPGIAAEWCASFALMCTRCVPLPSLPAPNRRLPAAVHLLVASRAARSGAPHVARALLATVPLFNAPASGPHPAAHLFFPAECCTFRA